MSDWGIAFRLLGFGLLAINALMATVVFWTVILSALK